MKRLMAILLALSLLALCGCGAPAQQPTEVPTQAPTEAPAEAPTEREIPTAPAEKNYTVTIYDANESPVAGVSLEVEGIVAVTDESGVATFPLEVGEYTVKVLELPIGYSFGYSLGEPQTEFKFEQGVTYLTIYVAQDDGDFEDTELVDDAPIEDISGEDVTPEG